MLQKESLELWKCIFFFHKNSPRFCWVMNFENSNFSSVLSSFSWKKLVIIFRLIDADCSCAPKQVYRAGLGVLGGAAPDPWVGQAHPIRTEPPSWDSKGELGWPQLPRVPSRSDNSSGWTGRCRNMGRDPWVPQSSPLLLSLGVWTLVTRAPRCDRTQAEVVAVPGVSVPSLGALYKCTHKKTRADIK